MQIIDSYTCDFIIVYDNKYNRFFCRQDEGFNDNRYTNIGIAQVEVDGLVSHEYPVSHEDNEIVLIDKPCEYVYVGGFN